MSTSAPSDNSPAVHEAPTYHIRPAKGWIGIDFKELWDYRELLYFLIWRDVKVRYKQTVIGAAWAIIQPLIMMVVFTFIFGKVAQLDENTNIPYPLITLCALVPWQFFSQGVLKASDSLVVSGNMLKKVFFPRLLAPLASVLSGAVDFAIAFCVLCLLLTYYHFAQPGWSFHLSFRLLALAPLMVLAFATAQGIGLWLAALNVQFRDVKHIVPFSLQFLTFISPVGFLAKEIPEAWRLIYAVNPMVGVIEGFRWALLDGQAGGTMPIRAPGAEILVSTVVATVLLLGGAFFFKRMERHFADVV